MHLPALGEMVQIPMFSEQGSLRSSTNSVDLFATSFLGEGGFGRVFKGVLRQSNGRFDGLVMKFSNPGCEEALAHEGEIYGRLEKLCGRTIPQSYGVFRGTFEGAMYVMLVLSYEGSSLESFDGITWLAR